MDNSSSLASNLANIEKQYKPEFADYPGNIDLNNRKVYHNPNGSIQTEYSIGVAFDPGDNYSINIPTIVNGKPVSTSEAKDHFMKTGEHLGVSYRNPGESVDDFYKRVDKQSTTLHERQDAYYNKGKDMASFIGDLKQSQQQVQDADAYRALVRQMEDDSLARNVAARTKAEYDNAHMGYGLTRADVAKAMGRPTSEVSMDTLGDAELQQLGATKMANQRAALEAMASYNQPREQPTGQEVNPVMAQAGQDMSAGRLGLAGQMSGRAANPAVAQRFVDSIPTPGGINMNADKYVPGRQTGESSDIMPSNDQDIRTLKAKGAY